MMTGKKPKKLSAAKSFAAIERISIAGLVARMGPVGLHVYADAYLKAALALPEPAVPFEPVRPYLVCHSIELGLKAFLSLRGDKMIDMMEGGLGHNLEALLRAAIERGLNDLVSLTDSQRIAVCQATTYYAGKVFEYPAIGEALSAYPQLPSLHDLFEVAAHLVDALRKPCQES
jgi:hypothetical protein